MTTITENPMQDAPASVETTYTISVSDGFEGRLEGVTYQDWVRVELVAGKTYSITLAGTEENDYRHNQLVGGPGDDVLDGGAGFD